MLQLGTREKFAKNFWENGFLEKNCDDCEVGLPKIIIRVDSFNECIVSCPNHEITVCSSCAKQLNSSSPRGSTSLAEPGTRDVTGVRAPLSLLTLGSRDCSVGPWADSCNHVIPICGHGLNT